MYVKTDFNPLVSVVIPVKNGEVTLGHCLRSIKRSYYKNLEVIVVDDHSTDGSASVAAQFNCKYQALEGASGANAARNTGAAVAAGDVIVFIDSDVVVNRETILGIVEQLDDEGTDAVVGIYTAKHRHESLVSQYKNLWVRYSYIKSPPVIDWLFGAISGIKRAAFVKLGGFDTSLMARHGNDDIEAGKRLARQNVNIILDMEIEVEHLKRYNLWSFVRNEFLRSVGFAKLAVRTGEAAGSIGKGFVNVYPMFIVATLFSIVLVASAVAVVTGVVPPWGLGAAVLFYLGLNIRFLNYLEQVRGLFAMMTMVPFLLLDHLVCFAGSVVGLLVGIFGPKEKK